MESCECRKIGCYFCDQSRIKPLPERCAVPTLEVLMDEVANAGYTPSSGSFEDENVIFAFSVESVPGAMNHPRFDVSYNKITGWLRVGRNELRIKSEAAQ